MNNTQIADGCNCSRTTVIDVIKRADECRISYPLPDEMSDFDYIHREMQKSGVTLTLLWVEYCETCRESRELPYKTTQFNKYYNDTAGV